MKNWFISKNTRFIAFIHQRLMRKLENDIDFKDSRLWLSTSLNYFLCSLKCWQVRFMFLKSIIDYIIDTAFNHIASRPYTQSHWKNPLRTQLIEFSPFSCTLPTNSVFFSGTSNCTRESSFWNLVFYEDFKKILFVFYSKNCILL